MHTKFQKNRVVFPLYCTYNSPVTTFIFHDFSFQEPLAILFMIYCDELLPSLSETQLCLQLHCWVDDNPIAE